MEKFSVLCHRFSSHFCFIFSIFCVAGNAVCYTPEIGDNSIENGQSETSEGRGGDCPIAFHKIGNKCYFYGYFKLNWFRAMEFCHSFGESVSLACIESQEENQHLKEWLILNGKHYAH